MLNFSYWSGLEDLQPIGHLESCPCVVSCKLPGRSSSTCFPFLQWQEARPLLETGRIGRLLLWLPNEPAKIDPLDALSYSLLTCRLMTIQTMGIRPPWSNIQSCKCNYSFEITISESLPIYSSGKNRSITQIVIAIGFASSNLVLSPDLKNVSDFSFAEKLKNQSPLAC
eukprot:Gb_38943 [translate_table: standard]